MEKKIKITKGHYWYTDYIGVEFDVLGETSTGYLVGVMSDIEFYIDKCDCDEI